MANTMIPAQKLQYIADRFGWLSDALMGDLNTFKDGIDLFLRNKKDPAYTKGRGGGNVAFTIPINTGLELASALFAGTEYKYGKAYNATANVKSFVNKYFPGIGGQIPLLLWDGVRNGVDHLFIPKTIQRGGDAVQFQFVVDPPSSISNVSMNGSTILIQINSLEFYQVLKQAITAYWSDLQVITTLQDHFIEAWISIEKHVRVIKKDDKERNIEVDQLKLAIKKSNSFALFV